MQKGHENELDAPVFVSVLLQAALNLIVEDKPVFGPFQTFQMMLEAFQQRRICRGVRTRQGDLLNNWRE